MNIRRSWILVADATRARLFRPRAREDRLEDALVFDIEIDIPRSRDIGSDRPGRSFDRAGQGRHAEEPPTDPKRHAKAEFARSLAHRLEDLRNKDGLSELIVIAPPTFLGDLRSLFSTPLRAIVVEEHAKDIAHLTLPRLDDRLGTLLTK
ncbi:MAG: host attachment protein [Alphaproteobacteria bacterium]